MKAPTVTVSAGPGTTWLVGASCALTKVGAGRGTEGVTEGGDEGARAAVTAVMGDVPDWGTDGETDERGLEAELGPPLGKAHAGVGAEQSAEGSFTGTHDMAKLSEGAGVARLRAQHIGD